MNYRRVFLIILDGCGIGVQPDYKEFHSQKTNTIGGIYKHDKSFHLPFLESSGLDRMLGLKISKSRNCCISARIQEKTAGNDTFAGVWEMFGIVFNKRFASGTGCIDIEILKTLEQNKLKTICNSYLSGYIALDKYFPVHKQTGNPILYLSNDGVILLAAHISIMLPDDLNSFAEKISKFLKNGRFTRIITRPFEGKPGGFVRIEEKRKDFMLAEVGSVNPIEQIINAGVSFHATKHLERIFCYPRGISTVGSYKDTKGLIEYIEQDFKLDGEGVYMYVLPDTDNLGHKKDIGGFGKALKEIDLWLGSFSSTLKTEDLLLVTADHGCDPSIKIRGHCREYVPLFAFSPQIVSSKLLPNTKSFSDIGQTILRVFSLPAQKIGIPLEELL